MKAESGRQLGRQGGLNEFLPESLWVSAGGARCRTMTCYLHHLTYSSSGSLREQCSDRRVRQHDL